jgi:hypothetical protein
MPFARTASYRAKATHAPVALLRVLRCERTAKTQCTCRHELGSTAGMHLFADLLDLVAEVSEGGELLSEGRLQATG